MFEFFRGQPSFLVLEPLPQQGTSPLGSQSMYQTVMQVAVNLSLPHSGQDLLGLEASQRPSVVGAEQSWLLCDPNRPSFLKGLLSGNESR